MGGRVLPVVDLLDPAHYLDGSIHAHFRALPWVSWQPKGFWAVCGYPEARQVLTHPELFSSAYGSGAHSPHDGEDTPPDWDSLNLSDPPRHSRLRRQVESWLKSINPTYQKESELLRGLPRQTLQALLGLTASQARQLQDCARNIAYAGGRHQWEEAEAQLRLHLETLHCPLELPRQDQIYLLRLLVLSGLESTTTALASLRQHFQQARPLGNERFLEELLRLYPPIQRFGRRVMKPTRLGDRELRPGQRVVVFFAAANRDPRIFEQPDQWCPARRTPHLSFGAGPHRCPGARLARMQMRWLLQHTHQPSSPPGYYASSFCLGPLDCM